MSLKSLFLKANGTDVAKDKGPLFLASLFFLSFSLFLFRSLSLFLSPSLSLLFFILFTLFFLISTEKKAPTHNPGTDPRP